MPGFGVIAGADIDWRILRCAAVNDLLTRFARSLILWPLMSSELTVTLDTLP